MPDSTWRLCARVVGLADLALVTAFMAYAIDFVFANSVGIFGTSDLPDINWPVVAIFTILFIFLLVVFCLSVQLIKVTEKEIDLTTAKRTAQFWIGAHIFFLCVLLLCSTFPDDKHIVLWSFIVVVPMIVVVGLFIWEQNKMVTASEDLADVDLL